MADQLSSDDEPFEYDSSMSTSKYTVYKAPRRGLATSSLTHPIGILKLELSNLYHSLVTNVMNLM